jgi:hypothetical protein
MPKIVSMTSGGFRRPDFEVSRAFRGDSPVGTIDPYNDIANEIPITLGTRNDWPVQAVKDLTILQPSIDPKLERSPVVGYATARVLL